MVRDAFGGTLNFARKKYTEKGDARSDKLCAVAVLDWFFERGEYVKSLNPHEGKGGKEVVGLGRRFRKRKNCTLLGSIEGAGREK